MKPIVDVGQALARSASGDIVRENDLVIFGAVGPDSRINHIKGMGGLNPRFLCTDDIGVFKSFSYVSRVASHLVEKGQCKCGLEMFRHVAAVIVGTYIAGVDDPRRGFALGGGVEQTSPFKKESRKGLGGFWIIFDPR